MTRAPHQAFCSLDMASSSKSPSALNIPQSDRPAKGNSMNLATRTFAEMKAAAEAHNEAQDKTLLARIVAEMTEEADLATCRHLAETKPPKA